MHNEQILTPDVLQQIAQRGDVEAATAALYRLEQPDESNEKLVAGVVAIGVRYQLGGTFSDALEHLDVLGAAVEGDIETGNFAEESSQFEERVREYLERLSMDVETAVDDKESLSALQLALQDETKRERALRQLAHGSEVDLAWLSERAAITSGDAKENLWELIGDARDIRALLSDDNEKASLYISEWQASVKQAIDYTRRGLEEAAHWLQKPEVHES